MPDPWTYGITDELKRLGLDLSPKKIWDDDIDEDCELVITMGQSPTSCFYNAEETKENKTWHLRGRKIIAHVWDIYEHKYELDIWYGGKFQTYFDFLKTCDGVVAFSQETVDILAKHGINSEEQLSYFDDVSIDKLPEVEKKDQIITCTRFAAEKNHYVNIMAQTLIPCRWKFIMTSPPCGQTMGQVLLEMAKEWGIPTEVQTTIPYEDVLKEIKESRLMITVPTHEGFGVTPKDAIWAGTPVIVSDIPPFREHHGYTIPMVNPYDPMELARVIDNVWKEGFDLTEAKKKIEPLTIHNQAIKFVEYLTRKNFI